MELENSIFPFHPCLTPHSGRFLEEGPPTNPLRMVHLVCSSFVASLCKSVLSTGPSFDICQVTCECVDLTKQNVCCCVSHVCDCMAMTNNLPIYLNESDRMIKSSRLTSARLTLKLDIRADMKTAV